MSAFRTKCFSAAVFLLGIFFAALSFAGIAGAASEERPAPVQVPAPVTPPPPGLFQLSVPGAEQPVRLKSVAVRSEIRGGFAETTLDMIFYNPNNRVLEGELQFPLLDNQSISGLALDIQGEMREGVPVNKARGQQVFEDVIRRKVDPALLQATQGNNYKLRLYPIPAQGVRRAQVRVLERLAVKGDAIAYTLPLEFASALDDFSLEVLVASPDGAPEASAGELGLVLQPAGTLYSGKVEKKNLSPKGTLAVSLPAPLADKGGVSAVRFGGKVYFSAAVPVETASARRTPPETVTILWDASASGQERDHGREFDLLDRYFKAMGTGEARLIVLRDAAEAPRTFAVRQGDWNELKAALNKTDYDGATNLAAWSPTADCKEYLLFSDGLANFGQRYDEARLPVLAPDQRLYPITSSTKADYAFLRHAAKGLPVINLLSAGAAQSADILLGNGTRAEIDGLALAGKGEVLLSPESRSPLPAGSPEGKETSRAALCLLAGWIDAAAAQNPVEISLNVTGPDGRARKVTLTVPSGAELADHAGPGAPLPARLWAAYKIAELEGDRQRNKKAIARLGEEFGVVSRETSLIVLETPEDYARYGVAPPPALAGQVEQIRARMRDSGSLPEEGEAMPMETLLGMWKTKVDWWKTDYPLKPAKRDKTSGPPAPGRAGAGRPVEQRVEGNDEAESFTARQRVRANALHEEMAPDALPAPPPSPTAAQAPAEPAKKAKDAESSTAIGVEIQPWRSDAPYIKRMSKAKDADLYAIYLDERPAFKNSSAFYLDAADRFFERGMKDLGLRVLSNLAEMDLENRQILRMLAYRLIQAKEARLAVGVLERVRELAPYEPQSHRDLALALAALDDRQEAANLLYETATRRWSDRFGDINVIALTELNALIATAPTPLDTRAFDPRLSDNLASDLRVVLSWDTDNSDMDLWVTGPDGESVYYSHPLGRMGGRISRDCTQGYGPEEFMLKKAVPGTYRVEADYYGDSRQDIAGEVTLALILQTGFGTAAQKETVTTMRLKNKKGKILVGNFKVEPAKK